jgi:integrase
MLYTRLFENHGIPSHYNPFHKSLWPAKERVKSVNVPNEEEAILAFAEKEDTIVFAALTLIRKHGCRRGAFHGMQEKGGKVVTKSKGKYHSFEFDESDIELLKAHPFGQYTPEQLGNKINYLLQKACKHGVVAEVFSAHDFRHAFARRLYKETNNIGLVSGRLGHRQISTTEIYLGNLKRESL